jgi:hypothetical protein
MINTRPTEKSDFGMVDTNVADESYKLGNPLGG